jgi:SynChlorMet cassette radical SAM/SPASM protein ScmE
MPHNVMRTPRSLDLEITSRCNANCRYCYYLNNPDVNYADLPTETWLAFFAELARCQVMNVTLQGGEPMIREDFLTLVDGVVANRMRFSVLTNGSLLTPHIAKHLKESGRCDQVQVSLDGSNAEIHEKLRGKGTFGPALSAIKLLQVVEIPVTVRVTIHPGNIDDLASITHLLLDELMLPSFSTNAASSLGTSSKYDSDSLLKPLERLKAMRLLAVLDTAYPGRIQASAGPLADWHMFQAMEEARQNSKPISGRGRLVGCGCIFDRLAVRSDGTIIPCVMLPQMVLGQLGEDRLDKVWLQSPALKEMRSRWSVPLSSFDDCHECQWLESCTGNCPGTAYSLTGEINRPCPETCLKRFHDDVTALGESLW